MPHPQAILLDGDQLAERLRGEMKADAAQLKARGIQPKMATVLVGDDPASASYVARKHADCAQIGIAVEDMRLPATIAADELLAVIAALNADASVHGFMVQLPLPAGLDGAAMLEAVRPDKDIDGLHPINLGRLLGGQPGILPCTPAAILTLLRAYDIPLAGAEVAIIGRGNLVGRPLAVLLSQRGIDATVTLLHSGSRDLAATTRRADIIISAAGLPNLIKTDMVKPGAAVIGVGISYVDGAMISDIAAGVANVAGWITPPHGSVGALTRAMLLKNLLQAAARQ
ncbi:bifunctional 5,10-methylenetetrahydrofolate dehydrogenase/5,10-methenyltetrahydrofolate cyclohydrolase [Devosia neptuniae]|uniref:Bifunctional protein FolD n=1 Tax=Devosia neptuniae TaxID=191302 RepID=A0ABY6CIT7_9HYPH|nr:bifunctional 5,10-methylenetetrahydrofolate dehydrogenase/5,10-methenyltetrahydrofolate cyclohydrolase [Devosia neptuniae]UXN69958.1 bifunctional 5,10-methylenetetrahydrofolate dehydrogenase/5,10-methenyltetrahydrofolate cyclohydrolase [Devosia neptuniae]